MDPLEEATTDALLDELARRFTGLLVVTFKAVPGSDAADVVSVRYHGGGVLARGLAHEAVDYLAEEAAAARKAEYDPDAEP